MVSEWQQFRLGEVVSCSSGSTPSKQNPSFWDGEIPWVSAKDMKSFYLCGSEDRITEQALSEGAKIAPRGAVLVLTRGMTLLSDVPICLLKSDSSFNQDVKAIQANDPVLAGRYLPYLLLGHKGKLQSLVDLAGHGTGRLPTDLLLAIDVSLPPPREQQAIAHILGVLDDKIELNRKTNETLETMARALFKSWFVDFDPVRAKAEGRPTGLPGEISDLFPDSFEESELGEIPSGWRFCSVNDLCEWVSSGGTPSRSRKDFWEDGTIPWFKTGELNDAPLLDSAEKINELALGNSSCKLWEAGTILFAIYASPTVGRLGVLTESGTSNQAAAGLKAKPTFGTPFLRRTLLFSRDELQNIAVGAAQQNINVQILKDHKVVDPGATLASHYSNAIVSMDEQQICLARNTRELCSLRDALLPKLISGELRIPDAERLLAEVGI